MTTKLLFLVLPALALAKIDVELSGDFNAENSNLNVYYSGNEIGVITDNERVTFHLDDNTLKNSVNAYFGKRPDDAYLRSPTPWGDLYKTYGWSQVTRTLVPKSGRLLQIKSQPQIVVQQVFENNSTKDAIFNVAISQKVENTVTSTWSKEGSLSVGQDIEYKINVEGIEGGGKTSFDYTSSWGENTEKSQSITIGSTSALEVKLKPGQAVVAQLQATRGTIQIEVEYEASLSGATAINYAKTYKGHHFWALDIRGVMDSGNLSNKIKSREVIEIGFYANSKVVVHDKALGGVLMAVEC